MDIQHITYEKFLTLKYEDVMSFAASSDVARKVYKENRAQLWATIIVRDFNLLFGIMSDTSNQNLQQMIVDDPSQEGYIRIFQILLRMLWAILQSPCYPTISVNDVSGCILMIKNLSDGSPALKKQIYKRLWLSFGEFCLCHSSDLLDWIIKNNSRLFYEEDKDTNSDFTYALLIRLQSLDIEKQRQILPTVYRHFINPTRLNPLGYLSTKYSILTQEKINENLENWYDIAPNNL